MVEEDYLVGFRIILVGLVVGVVGGVGEVGLRRWMMGLVGIHLLVRGLWKLLVDIVYASVLHLVSYLQDHLT